MKNLYENKNVLVERLNQKRIKETWKLLKNKKSPELALYHFLSKYNLSKAMNKSFTDINHDSNKVKKSFFVPSIAKYKAIISLMSCLYKYGIENYEKTNFFEKRNGFIMEVVKYDLNYNKENNLRKMLESANLNFEDFIVLYSLVGSYFLEMFSQIKNFSEKNIVFIRKEIEKQRQYCFKKLENMKKDRNNRIVALSRNVLHFNYLLSKKGSVEKNILSAYQPRIDRKIDKNEYFHFHLNVSCKENPDHREIRRIGSHIIPGNSKYIYNLEENCKGFTSKSKEMKKNSFKYRGLTSAIFSTISMFRQENKIKEFSKKHVGLIDHYYFSSEYETDIDLNYLILTVLLVLNLRRG